MSEYVNILFDKPLFYLLCLHIWELSSFSALLFSVKHENKFKKNFGKKLCVRLDSNQGNK